MVGIFPLAPRHDPLKYIHHVHLMQRGQNQGVTFNCSIIFLVIMLDEDPESNIQL